LAPRALFHHSSVTTTPFWWRRIGDQAPLRVSSMMRGVVNDREDVYIHFESLVITVYNERQQEKKKTRSEEKT
jgi:hypothetical protein